MVSSRELAKELRDLQTSSGWESDDANRLSSRRRSSPVPEPRLLREEKDEKAESSTPWSRRSASISIPESESEPEPEPELPLVKKGRDVEAEEIWSNIKRAGEHIDQVLVG